MTRHIVTHILAAASCCALTPAVPAFAQFFSPGNLVVSRTVYDGNPANVKIGTILPVGCATTTGGCSPSTGAPYDGSYPSVFNNANYDPNFGITTPIFLDELTTSGMYLRTWEVPNSISSGAPPHRQLVTSFTSKSELSLNLSVDGKYISFLGYVAPVDRLDVSNGNTPLVIDPTNADGQIPTYRAAARIDKHANFAFTLTNAYSGDNGRAAILNDSDSEREIFYTAGNAGGGANPEPAGIVAGAGAQIFPFVGGSEALQNPGLPTPVGSFNVTQVPGAKADKFGKDDNYRALTIFNNVLYYAKGSGGNGVNTVYFVDTVGGACPNGSGLPRTGAGLPTTSIPYDPATVASTGLTSNMCILAGLPAVPAKKANPLSYPFGIFFANATTLYVADEGDGFADDATLYTHAAAQTTAGLQKWVFNKSTQLWTLAYVLNQGLNLGVPYTVAGYPTGNNAGTGLPWAPATGGLRNLAGLVHADGTVSLFATTSTVSGNGDQGADPNQLVSVTDTPGNMDPTKAGTFSVIRSAKYAEVLRGVSLSPGTNVNAY